MDLIVLDMVMPKGINGRETYEKILKIHPGQKAIIASGSSETEGYMIESKPTYDKLEQRVKELEDQNLGLRQLKAASPMISTIS